MLCNDHAGLGHPMIFFVQLTLEGAFEEGPFRAALAAARPRHPLLFSVVIGDPAWRTAGLAWRALGDDAHVRVSWYADADDGDAGGGGGGAGTAGPPAWAAINIHAEPGVSLHLARGGAPAAAGAAVTTVLTAAFHHAATDGRGAVRFLEDVLAAHAGLTSSGGGGGRADPHRFMRPVDLSMLTRVRGRDWPRRDVADGLVTQAYRLVARTVHWVSNALPPAWRRRPPPSAVAQPPGCRAAPAPPGHRTSSSPSVQASWPPSRPR